MSNDLISRRAVIDGIIELLKSPYANDPSLGMERRDAMKTVGDLCVRSLPTSYDVDKVAERLEKKILEIKDQLMHTSDEDMAVRLRCKMHGLDEALEIVRAGIEG